MGVGDSKSLVVVEDLLNKGLDDSFLLELCQLKSCGESLSKLGDSGRYLYASMHSLSWWRYECLCVFLCLLIAI